MFSGDLFETDSEYARLKNLFIGECNDDILCCIVHVHTHLLRSRVQSITSFNLVDQFIWHHTQCNTYDYSLIRLDIYLP